MKITTDTQTFEVVNAIPYGFKIWNIPTDGIEGYVPLYEDHETIAHQVNPETLKLIKSDHSEALIKIASYYGIRNLEQLNRRIARLEKSGKKPIELQNLLYIKPIMTALPWE